MPRKTLVLLACLIALPATASRRRAVGVGPQYPPCSMITGTAAVTFTLDRGQTVAPSAESKEPIAYTYGLASMLDEPDTLVAWHRDDLLISTDAGCSWRIAATVTGAPFPPKLEPARGGRVYAWAENQNWAVRYDARGARNLKVPVEILGLGADPSNGERVRVGGTDGTIRESVDAGETWTQIGALPGAPYMFYRFAFHPANLDHIVAGTVSNGAYVSRNGGKTWSRAIGIANSSANVFNIVFSPVNPDRVWAMGIDLSQSDGSHPSFGRHIYLSDDGGESYGVVVDDSPDVNLINGPIMAADPTNADVLYFVFGTYIFDYGTDLFRYDASTKTVTLSHHSEIDDINAISFSRRDPGVMYLGMEMER